MTTELDVYTKLPRYKDQVYTRITDEQIKNLHKDSSPHFMAAIPVPPDEPRNWKQQFVELTSEHNVRNLHDVSKSFCSINPSSGSLSGGKMSKVSVESEPSAFAWGPRSLTPGNNQPYTEATGTKCVERNLGQQWNGQFPNVPAPRSATDLHENIGERTLLYGERPVERYEVAKLYEKHYERNPTAIEGKITMMYGRPNTNYYTQRNPETTTWTGSSCVLNRTRILETAPRARTTAQYQAEHAAEREGVKAAQAAHPWPTITEVTDKYILHSATLRGRQGRM